MGGEGFVYRGTEASTGEYAVRVLKEPAELGIDLLDLPELQDRGVGVFDWDGRILVDVEAFTALLEGDESGDAAA